jgi:peroxiredoxin Q/BCP
MKTIRNCILWVSAIALAVTATSVNAEIVLRDGDSAPRFTGHDQDGKKFKLNSLIGKEVVLLYFYPKDDTGGCTAEACGLRDNMVELKRRGVEVIGVSFDKADSHKKFSFKYDLNFPLLADTDGKIADAYGVRMGPGIKMTRRASFLIGLNGKIVHITDSPDPMVHLREMEATINTITR